MLDETELKSWMETILTNQNFSNIEVKVEGNTAKGAGYMSDVMFVSVTGTGKNKKPEEHHLVMKCAKRSRALRQQTPIRESFLNEKYMYDTVFPAFVRFQEEKLIEQPFDTFPKYVGSFVSEDVEVIALENLKGKGFKLWDKSLPFPRNIVETVVRQYAKFHAISVAYKDQKPKEFEDLTGKIRDVFSMFVDTNMGEAFASNVEEAYLLLKDDLDENLARKLQDFSKKVDGIFRVIARNEFGGLKVILHGDCWNNNFMHRFNNKECYDLKIIDWQMSRVCLPVFDLSYFIFAVISEEDIKDLDVILDLYFDTFVDFLKQLGSDPSKLYSRAEFINDWTDWAKFGFMTDLSVHKFAFSNKEEIPDMETTVDAGANVTEAFMGQVANTEGFKKRIFYLVKYALEHNWL